jgi:hypothetical protein
MKFAHLLVSAYFAEGPETGLFVEAPAGAIFEPYTGGSRISRTPASLPGGAAARTPVRYERVSTSARRDTNSEQGTASMRKGS